MPSKSNNAKIISANPDSVDAVELKAQLVRSQVKLKQTEMLLSVTKRIAGLQNLTEIQFWSLVKKKAAVLNIRWRAILECQNPRAIVKHYV